jgi:hypothetical protein
MNEERLRQAMSENIPAKFSTRAETVLKTWATASLPALLSCDDGHAYVVKDHIPRQGLVTEYVAARLGAMLAAPVPSIRFVEVTDVLVAADPFLSANFRAGVWHGALWIPGCSERMGLDHVNELENRPRFARLAILYSWLGAADHQFIYENAYPYRVHSVDHGHFLPSGPNWTVESLSEGSPVSLDVLFRACSLTRDELFQVRARLLRITDELIIDCVRSAPLEWDVTLDQRVALARYLISRRTDLLALCQENSDADVLLRNPICS